MTSSLEPARAIEALTECVAWRIPQIEDLKAAVDAADSADFAADEEVLATFARYGGAAIPQAGKAAASMRQRK